MENADAELAWQQLNDNWEKARLSNSAFGEKLIRTEIKMHITVPIPKTEEVKITADSGYKVLLATLLLLFAILLAIAGIATRDMYGVYIALFLLLVMAAGFWYLSATWLVIGRYGIRCGDGTFMPWPDLYNCAIVTRMWSKGSSTSLYLVSKTEGLKTYNVDTLNTDQIGHYIAFYRAQASDGRTDSNQ